MFRCALLPVDGSEPSLAAVETAVRAVAPDGEILVCSVIPSVEALLTGIAASTPDSRAAIELAEHSQAARRGEAEGFLEEAVRRVEGAGGRVRDRQVLSGEPGPAILRAASESGCDVVVMATNGRSGWRRAILGSVADFVVRHAEQVPVLLVRRSGG